MIGVYHALTDRTVKKKNSEKNNRKFERLRRNKLFFLEEKLL